MKNMKKTLGTSHPVLKVLLLLWMQSLISHAVGELFPCSLSNMNVSATLVCDGSYDCDSYEDEFNCNYQFLQEGESRSIYMPRNYSRRFYNGTLLQTNATNGFRIVFQNLYVRSSNQVQIGTGNDPSDPQSVIKTIYGTSSCCPQDIYVETNEMWFAAIGGLSYTNLLIDVEIISVSLSNLFNCSRSNMNVSSDVLCDGLYHCDYYEDETQCNYQYLLEGESRSIYIPRNYTRRFYNATLLQTNATNGFRIVFQDLYVGSSNQVQIGTGNDPSDLQSVITTVHGTSSCCPDDIYVETNEMWFAAIGGLSYTNLLVDVDIISINLSNLFNCSRSNMNVSSDVLCDGLYHCANYEDESQCSKPNGMHNFDDQLISLEFPI